MPPFSVIALLRRYEQFFELLLFYLSLTMVFVVVYNSYPLIYFRSEIHVVNNDYQKSHENDTMNQNQGRHVFDFSGIQRPPDNFLVWSDQCRMPNVNPFTADVLKIYRPEKYSNCSSDLPLTKTIFDINSRRYLLHINTELASKFVKPGDNFTCCYQEIVRSGSGSKSDQNYKLLPCSNFHQDFLIPSHIDSLLVICKSLLGKREIQRDAHFLVQVNKDVQKRQGNGISDSRHSVSSVLLIGIDSVSRFNLRRTMPKTVKLLQRTNWIEMAGYNKVGENTYPNLMALLTGYNLTRAHEECGDLDKCPFIWKKYKKLGYVTAYAEDETILSTFNYHQKGFETPPVDYYLRPFMLAVEKQLKLKLKCGLSFCAGLKHSAEYVYDYALEFATRHLNNPHFGLFWTNTFSHNCFELNSSMDERMSKYLQEFDDRGIMERSIMIFFSDHGIRFGPLRNLPQGFLEERLPFFFIWLPRWFRLKYPEFVYSLEVNRNRLTNPYDIHNTLQHILELSERLPIDSREKAESCQNCQTIFHQVPENRSCNEIAIDDNWCACTPFESIPKDLIDTKKITNSVIDQMNSIVQNQTFASRCELLKLKQIVEASKGVTNKQTSMNSTDLVFLKIRFDTIPKDAKFEATTFYSVKNRTVSLKSIESVSRLNSYLTTSKCINDTFFKKYCICRKNID